MNNSRLLLRCLAAAASVAILTAAGSAPAKTAKDCEAEWRANKAAIQGAHKTKKSVHDRVPRGHGPNRGCPVSSGARRNRPAASRKRCAVPCSEPPRHQGAVRQTGPAPAQRFRPGQANSRRKWKRRRTAREKLWSGRTRAPKSIISRARGLTATRSRAPICAKRTPPAPACAPQKTRSARNSQPPLPVAGLTA